MSFPFVSRVQDFVGDCMCWMDLEKWSGNLMLPSVGSLGRGRAGHPVYSNEMACSPIMLDSNHMTVDNLEVGTARGWQKASDHTDEVAYYRLEIIH